MPGVIKTMKCPYCHKEFEPDGEEETKMILTKSHYDKLMRFACIGEVALSRAKK